MLLLINRLAILRWHRLTQVAIPWVDKQCCQGNYFNHGFQKILCGILSKLVYSEVMIGVVEGETCSLCLCVLAGVFPFHSFKMVGLFNCC